MERKDAILSGLSKYNTGRQCRYGHMSDRSTASGACCECVSDTQKTIRASINANKIIKPRYNLSLYTQIIYIIIDPRYIEQVGAQLSAYCGLIDPRFPAEVFRNSLRFKIGYGTTSHKYSMNVPIGHDVIVREMAANLLDTPDRRAEMARVLDQARRERERYVRQVEKDELVRPAGELPT
jgi:hypothetical protein